MTIERIPNHVEKALDTMLSQFNGATGLQALVRLTVEEVQTVENESFDLISQRQLDSSVGAQLDVYGKIVGQPRFGLPDADYRRLIRVRIQTNRTKTTIEEQIAIVLGATGALRVRYTPTYPAAYELEWEVPSPNSATMRTLILDFLLDARPAGVKLGAAVEYTAGYWGFLGDPNALPLGVGAWTAEILQE
jgi:hypothetical protein